MGSFFKVNKSLGKYSDVDRLYLMEIKMEEFEEPVYKFGKASGKNSKSRMLQIIESYFNTYRVTPVVKIVRDREVEDVFTKETSLHRQFKEKKIEPSKTFSGCTECFHVDKDTAIEAYEEAIKEEKCSSS